MQGNQIYLSAREVAEKLGISRSGIYSLIRSSDFPTPIKFGRLSRWKIADIEHWLNTQEQKTFAN
ncbi:helix-turn-helix transcriptional regulator [Avibacterium sp. 20-129]|uniref:helix-turn-helix transcriptional regulator n=1 Tax=Avibacterium sp. 20-129 TaxID=2911525 RepID=UPI002246A028|nr:AlpA family phage regulatory protein [Avibacterium sp. 20-129]MCW9698145.1 helix-turn-helix domain-containing protein [Avibacterium sp. 20-129]